MKRISFMAVIIVVASLSAGAAEIDFEGVAAGTILDEVSTGFGVTGNVHGTIGVDGYNPAMSADTKCDNAPPCNAAVVFDSSNPPVAADDYDLGTPNECKGGLGIEPDARRYLRNTKRW